MTGRNPKKFIQGNYVPNNPQKYVSQRKVNGEAQIVYRSSWELSFCKYLDRNENVLQWSSEEYEIRYVLSTDGRTHRYFPDFWMKVRTGNGKIKEFLVEIKPTKEVMDPQDVITEGMSTKTKTDIIETYIKNRDKWQAAEQFCKSKGWGFKILTEKDILYVKRHMNKMSPESSSHVGNPQVD